MFRYHCAIAAAQDGAAQMADIEQRQAGQESALEIDVEDGPLMPGQLAQQGAARPAPEMCYAVQLVAGYVDRADFSAIARLETRRLQIQRVDALDAPETAQQRRAVRQALVLRVMLCWAMFDHALASVGA